MIELAALGPAPMSAMLLADLGAEVVRIERKSSGAAAGDALFDPKVDILNRSRRVLQLDLKQPQAIAAVLELLAGADCLLEGYRPGVMERLGLGPQVCLEPSFAQLWTEIAAAIGDAQFLAAHNARFDRKVLETCCQSAGLEPPRPQRHVPLLRA